MIKWLVIAVALVGAFVLTKAYLPQVWGGHFTVLNTQVPYAYLVLAGFVILAGSRLK